MIEVKIETDRALVSSPTLRVRTRRFDYYAWWARRPRFARYDRRADA